MTSYFDNFCGHDVSDGTTTMPRRQKLLFDGHVSLTDRGKEADRIDMVGAPQWSNIWTFVTSSACGELARFVPVPRQTNGPSSFIGSLTVMQTSGSKKDISLYDFDISYDGLTIANISASIPQEQIYEKDDLPEQRDVALTFDSTGSFVVINAARTGSADYVICIRSYDSAQDRYGLQHSYPQKRIPLERRVPTPVGKTFGTALDGYTKQRTTLNIDKEFLNVYESVGGIVIEPRGKSFISTGSSFVLGIPPNDIVTLDFSEIADEDQDWVLYGSVTSKATGSSPNAARQPIIGWMNPANATGSLYLDPAGLLGAGSLSFSGSTVTLSAGSITTGSNQSGTLGYAFVAVQRSNDYNFVATPIRPERTNVLKAGQRNKVTCNGDTLIGNTLVFPGDFWTHSTTDDANVVKQYGQLQYNSGSDSSGTHEFEVPNYVDRTYAIDIAFSGSRDYAGGMVQRGWYMVENGLITSASFALSGSASGSIGWRQPNIVAVTGSFVSVIVE